MQEEKFVSGSRKQEFQVNVCSYSCYCPKEHGCPLGPLFVLPVVHIFVQSCCCHLVSSHHCFGVFCSSLLSLLPWSATGFCTHQNPASATIVISVGCGSLFFYPSHLVLCHCPATGFCTHKNPALAIASFLVAVAQSSSVLLSSPLPCYWILHVTKPILAISIIFCGYGFLLYPPPHPLPCCWILHAPILHAPTASVITLFLVVVAFSSTSLVVALRLGASCTKTLLLQQLELSLLAVASCLACSFVAATLHQSHSNSKGTNEMGRVESQSQAEMKKTQP